MLWEDGLLQDSWSSPTLCCSKCCCGWFCWAFLLNWNLACPSLSSRCSTGSMKDCAAQKPESQESWALILSSTRTVSLCSVHSLQSSWRGRWATDLWLTDKAFAITKGYKSKALLFGNGYELYFLCMYCTLNQSWHTFLFVSFYAATFLTWGSDVDSDKSLSTLAFKIPMLN